MSRIKPLVIAAFLTTGCWLAQGTGGSSPGDDTDSETESDTDTGPEPIPFEDGIELDWALRAGGPGTEIGNGVLPLPNGDVVVGGRFADGAVFGEGQPGEITLEGSEGGGDMFLARYDASGQLVWATTVGVDDEDPYALFKVMTPFVLAPDGSIVVSGVTSGGAVFGSGEPNETALVPTESPAHFLARYTQDGGFVEVVETGLTAVAFDDDDYIDDVYAFPSAVPLDDGSILLTGAFTVSETVGPEQSEPIEIAAAGGVDFLCALVDTELQIVWARAFGGPGDDVGGCRPLEGEGALVVGGSFDQPLILGEGGANETTLEPGGERDMFAARYDTDGELSWAVQIGGSGGTEASNYGLSPLYGWDTPTSSVDLVGLYLGEIGLGSTTSAEQTMLEPSLDGVRSIFIARYDLDGELLFAKHIACEESCEAHYPWPVNDDGAFLMSGRFDRRVTLGSGEPGEVELSSSNPGVADIFMALFRSDGSLIWARRDGGPFLDFWGLIPADDESLFVGGSFGSWGPYNATTTVGVSDPNETELESAGDLDFILGRFVAE